MKKNHLNVKIITVIVQTVLKFINDLNTYMYTDPFFIQRFYLISIISLSSASFKISI